MQLNLSIVIKEIKENKHEKFTLELKKVTSTQHKFTTQIIIFLFKKITALAVLSLRLALLSLKSWPEVLKILSQGTLVA